MSRLPSPFCISIFPFRWRFGNTLVRTSLNRITWLVVVIDRGCRNSRQCSYSLIYHRFNTGFEKFEDLISVCYVEYRGAYKSLARPGRKQANVSVRMAWISFGALPCRKRNLMTARVSIWSKKRASLTCFRVCFLPGRAKDLSAPRGITHFLHFRIMIYCHADSRLIKNRCKSIKMICS